MTPSFSSRFRSALSISAGMLALRAMCSAGATSAVGLLFLSMTCPSISSAQVPTRLHREAQVLAASPATTAASLGDESGNPGSLKFQPTTADTKATVIVVIGDSLSEGFGVERSQAFPDRAQEILRARGHAVRVVNGGISGSVTADADRRLNWYLKIKPKILLLELGGNDALKGTPIAVIKANLEKAVDLAKANHLMVILAGMQIYSSYGESYTHEFAEMYRTIAREKKIKLIPFLLQGVALKPELNQADMKHPNVKGHEIVAHTLADFLEPLL